MGLQIGHQMGPPWVGGGDGGRGGGDGGCVGGGGVEKD